MYPTVGYESTHSSQSYQDPSVYPTQSYNEPETSHVNWVSSTHNTEHYQTEPSMYPVESGPYSTTKSSEIHSTFSTFIEDAKHLKKKKKSPKQTQQPIKSMSTMKTEPCPSSMPGTAGSNGDQPQMYATFYFEFGLFDDIESIHSVELEREFDEPLTNIWMVDPAMVYDGDKAVGITFNGEVAFDENHNIQFAPGSPIGAVVLDKVAELLKENDDRNKFGNKMMMNKAKIISEKRVFEINEYMPMMIVCAAVGTAVIVGAKLYSSYLGRKEYQP